MSFASQVNITVEAKITGLQSLPDGVLNGVPLSHINPIHAVSLAELLGHELKRAQVSEAAKSLDVIGTKAVAGVSSFRRPSDIDLVEKAAELETVGVEMSAMVSVLSPLVAPEIITYLKALDEGRSSEFLVRHFSVVGCAVSIGQDIKPIAYENLSGANAIFVADQEKSVFVLRRSFLPGLFIAGLQVAERKAYFGGVIAPGVDAQGFSAAKASLIVSDFYQGQFQHAILHNALIGGTALIEADLTEVQLPQSEIVDSDFSCATLNGIELGGARITRSKLLGVAAARGAVLRGVSIVDSAISGNWACAIMVGTHIATSIFPEETHFEGVDATDAKFLNLDMSLVVFSSATVLERTDFTGSKIAGNLTRVNCRGAIFVGTQFQNESGDTKAILVGTDLTNATLQDLVLDGNPISEVIFTGTQLTNVKIMGKYPGISFRGAIFKDGVVLEGNFTGADFTAVKFEGAVTLQGKFDRAKFPNCDLSTVTFADGTSLADANVRNTKLPAKMSQLTLARARFDGATAPEAMNVSGSILDHSSWTKATVNRVDFTTLKDGQLVGVNFTEANAHGINCSSLTVIGCTLEKAKMPGANFKDAVVAGLYCRGADLSGSMVAWKSITGGRFERARLMSLQGMPESVAASGRPISVDMTHAPDWRFIKAVTIDYRTLHGLLAAGTTEFILYYEAGEPLKTCVLNCDSEGILAVTKGALNQQGLQQLLTLGVTQFSGITYTFAEGACTLTTQEDGALKIEGTLNQQGLGELCAVRDGCTVKFDFEVIYDSCQLKTTEVGLCVTGEIAHPILEALTPFVDHFDVRYSSPDGVDCHLAGKGGVSPSIAVVEGKLSPHGLEMLVRAGVTIQHATLWSHNGQFSCDVKTECSEENPDLMVFSPLLETLADASAVSVASPSTSMRSDTGTVSSKIQPKVAAAIPVRVIIEKAMQDNQSQSISWELFNSIVGLAQEELGVHPDLQVKLQNIVINGYGAILTGEDVDAIEVALRGKALFIESVALINVQLPPSVADRLVTAGFNISNPTAYVGCDVSASEAAASSAAVKFEGPVAEVVGALIGVAYPAAASAHSASDTASGYQRVATLVGTGGQTLSMLNRFQVQIRTKPVQHPKTCVKTIGMVIRQLCVEVEKIGIQSAKTAVHDESTFHGASKSMLLNEIKARIQSKSDQALLSAILTQLLTTRQFVLAVEGVGGDKLKEYKALLALVSRTFGGEIGKALVTLSSEKQEPSEASAGYEDLLPLHTVAAREKPKFALPSITVSPSAAGSESVAVEAVVDTSASVTTSIAVMSVAVPVLSVGVGGLFDASRADLLAEYDRVEEAGSPEGTG